MTSWRKRRRDVVFLRLPDFWVYPCYLEHARALGLPVVDVAAAFSVGFPRKPEEYAKAVRSLRAIHVLECLLGDGP